MDGRRSERKYNERPIAKPEFPLPPIFYPSKRSEMPTRQRNAKNATRERAFFYRKPSDSKNGPPVYSFYITDEPIEKETNN